MPAKMPPSKMEPLEPKRFAGDVDIMTGRVTGQTGSPIEVGPGRILEDSPANLLRVTVQIGARRFDEDLAEQARVAPNIEAIDEALVSNPGRYAEWAMLEVEARKEYDDIRGRIAVLEVDIKDAEARIYLEAVAYVPASLTPGWKPPTVDAVKAQVQVDPRRLALVKMKQELDAAALEAKGTLETLGVGKKTMEEKRECLLELARNWRQESQTQLTVRAEQFRPGGR